MVRDFTTESLSHDPIHGYIPFISAADLPDDETAEREILDHPWVQRLRHIHQLQTAWWVFPSAEHMRFQHVLGAMHLGSRVVECWYDSLTDACLNVPSRAYVECLVRMAALLHDVGHGPFGHFFDDHYLNRWNITHEDIGAYIIEHELGDLLRRIRRCPYGKMKPLEALEPRQIAWLIRRPPPGAGTETGHPDWLIKLRALFSGIYTVDNMDFVLRDAYMSGYNTKAFDVSRLLHYSFFTSAGLTIHVRGLSALVNFIETRANLFRIIYFHRTVRALDLARRTLPADDGIPVSRQSARTSGRLPAVHGVVVPRRCAAAVPQRRSQTPSSGRRVAGRSETQNLLEDGLRAHRVFSGRHFRADHNFFRTGTHRTPGPPVVAGGTQGHSARH